MTLDTNEHFVVELIQGVRVATSVTVTTDNGQRQARRLTGRVADIVVWLVERAELLTSSQKGKIQIDYAGEDLVIRGEDVTERKGK